MEVCRIKRILVVDDAIFMRKVLKTMLERNNYKVVGEAENGHAAVKKFISLNPDIVAMDIAMPIMDGIEALKVIKQIAPSSNVLMISALEQKEVLEQAISNGAKGFIAKPFSEEQVIGALEKL